MKGNNLSDNDIGKKLSQELSHILEQYKSQVDYLSASSKPLANLATASSALTITSTLLVLNGSNKLVIIFAGIIIVLMIFVISLALFFQLMVYRANFRLARVKFHANLDSFFTKEHFTSNEISHLTQLIKLSKDGLRALNRIEWSYHHILWRFFYVVVVIVFLFLTSATVLEIASRIDNY